jgi:hypothetical protein
MIAEGLVYLRSLPATPPAFRRHLGEAVGLWARGRRQRIAWAPHVANASGLIDTTIDDIKPRRKVAILGSGPLFDVPLEALARNFAEVILIDRAHLSTTSRRVSRYANVRREWRDLAGGLKFLGEIADLDWVVSMNLLSQLGAGGPEGKERETIDRHLDALTALPCAVTLVTDLDYRIFDRSGKRLEEFDLMHGRKLPARELQWKWEVAPLGEEGPDIRRVHSVAAWANWHAARKQ